MGTRLPNSIEIDLGRSVKVEIEGDRPQDHHAEVIKHYPPGKAKHRGKAKHPGMEQSKGRGPAK